MDKFTWFGFRVNFFLTAQIGVYFFEIKPWMDSDLLKLNSIKSPKQVSFKISLDDLPVSYFTFVVNDCLHTHQLACPNNTGQIYIPLCPVNFSL